jgi:hypothetical protein
MTFDFSTLQQWRTTMTSTTPNQNVRPFGANRARASVLPAGYPSYQVDEAERAVPKLHPGAAIAVAIIAVALMLTFVEIVFA